MQDNKKERYRYTCNYKVEGQRLPQPKPEAHRVFVVGALRQGLGGQVVMDAFGARHLCMATYLAGHSRMVSLTEGPGLVPDKKADSVIGDVLMVSSECLGALDRLANVIYHQRRTKIKVYDNATGEEMRAWCWFIKYPEKVHGGRLSGNFLEEALDEALEFETKVKAAKSRPPRPPITGPGTYYGTGYRPPEPTGATCTPSYIKEPTEVPVAPDAEVVVGSRADQVRSLKEGESAIVDWPGGRKVKYMRDNGVLRIMEIYGPGTQTPEGGPDEAAQAKEEDAPPPPKGPPPKADNKPKRASERIYDCKYCHEEIYWMVGAGWVTWESGSPVCIWQNSHAPQR